MIYQTWFTFESSLKLLKMWFSLQKDFKDTRKAKMKREWLLKVGDMAKAITAVIPIIIFGMDDGFSLANYLMILRFSLQQGNPKPNYPSHIPDTHR